ncbi:rhodanese-like domain-containing protein [Methylosoma difficile]
MERYLEFILNHYILCLALAVVSYLLVQELIDTALKKYGKVSPLLAVTKMNEADTVVIDVREPEDFIKGHIEDAITVPLGGLKEYLPKLEAYKKSIALVVCQNGMRSGAAANMLNKAGFENVQVITGGMDAWETEYKLPVKKSNKYKAK